MSPSKWGRDVKHKRGKKVGEMCDLERWIFNVASLWFDLHDNIFHEQSFGNSMPYLIRSIDLRIKLGWCINYCKNKGRSSTYCVLWIYKHFISFLVIFSMSDSTCVRITVLFTGKLLCIFYIFNHSGSTAVSVTPPLWSGISQQLINGLLWNFVLTFIVSQGMKPNDFDDLLTFPQATSWDSVWNISTTTEWIAIKFGTDSFRMDCNNCGAFSSSAIIRS